MKIDLMDLQINNNKRNEFFKSAGIKPNYNRMGDIKRKMLNLNVEENDFYYRHNQRVGALIFDSEINKICEELKGMVI